MSDQNTLDRYKQENIPTNIYNNTSHATATVAKDTVNETLSCNNYISRNLCTNKFDTTKT